MRELLLAAAVLVTTLAAPPAYAVVTVTGLSCGMSAGNDETGVINQNSGAYEAAVTGGPVTIVGDRPSELHVECNLYVNGSPRDNPRRAVVDGGGVLVSARVFGATDGDRIDLCTRVWWRSASSGVVSRRNAGCSAARRGVGLWPLMPKRFVVPTWFSAAG